MERTSTVQLVIEGTPDPERAPALSPELKRIIGTPRLQAGFDLQPPVRGAAAPLATVEARDDDLVELHLEGELRLLMRVADYREQFGTGPSRGGGGPAVLRIGATLPARSRERGVFQWVVKGLQLIGIDLTELAAAQLARHVDEKKGLDGLYGCPLAADTLALQPAPAVATGSDPLLVFIHGTMSSTEGSFGGLWSERKDVRLRLAQRYGGRSYAFEHKTFTESPVANALALANLLPAGARLHLVSHSRGGMVGELLCRCCRIGTGGGAVPAFDDADLALFGDGRQGSRGELLQLAEVLQKKRLAVERFVRVACPARGTTLASGRLDRYLALLKMGLSWATHADWVGDITWFIAAVAKERTNPALMPGLEAMMPDSATVKLLNRTGVMVDSDLRVIAGDYDGDGILGTVADWASQGFFGSENDVVVNTPSMYGGAQRLDSNQVERGWYYYAQGAQVYHFSYFKQPGTAGQLANGLLLDDARSAGFLPLSQAPQRDDTIARGIALSYLKEGLGSPLERRSPSADGTKPLLVLVPGIMGTHLKAGGKRIWIDFSEIAEGEFDRLAEEAAGVDTDGVVKMSYQALGDFLSSSHEVLYFPYDWRLSLRSRGKEFASFMIQVLDAARANGRPVRILAHSMGGLLVRMAAVLSGARLEGNGWWERFRGQSGNRLVQAGTPNNGSWTVPYVLTGRDAVIGMLKTVDLKHGRRDLLKIVCAFEGFLEMLPPEGGDDCFDPATWQKWCDADGGSWPLPDPGTLARCRENRKLLQEFDFDRERDLVRYVAGCADETPSGVRVSDGRLWFDSSPQGDGRVLWDTGIPPRVRTWYVNAKHGDLLNHEKAFKGLAEILGMGETTLLPDTRPAQRSERAKAGVLPDRSVPFYPDQAMLLRAGLGGELIPARARGEEAPGRCFRVAVCHGDLAAAKHPVAVGHYQGDTVSGTEAALDRRLAGLLSQRHALGIYPGPEGSSEVFVREVNRGIRIALVVGLGQVGDLTPALLTSGFTSALLKYATTPAARRCATEMQGLAVSTILIGSGAGWGLGVRDSVRALVEGACRANALLSELDGDPLFLSELEFLEVYEDRALQALKAVREFASLGVLGELEFDAVLRPGRGGRCRAMSDEDQDWWQRIKVEVDDQDVMKFTTLTGLARVEEVVLPTQRALVDRLVERAVTRSTVSQDDMVAIYNLVSPLALKERSPDQGDLLMMLDERAARYPWEMMHIRVGDTKIPLALKYGLVRQLSVRDYRQHPARSYRANALVVAEPNLGTSDLPPLPGARAEGESVAGRLTDHQYLVTRQFGAEAIDIMSALFADSYRILHLAGHGIYRYPIVRKLPDCSEKSRFVTGMVLDWPKADGAQAREPAFLTAVEVKQMPVVPELVFINCCFLGKVEEGSPPPSAGSENRNLFAASLAASFIGMGVRAVVAAGWAVNDTAAEAFASRFYDTLLGGASFGEAVSHARKAARDAGPPDCNTWAAYQCYGDPAYRVDGQRRAPAGRFFLAPREAVYEIRAIRERKRSDDGKLLDTAELLRELQRAESLIPHEWLTASGEIRAALGAAYGEFGRFQRAVEHYQAAVRSSDGSCTLNDLDQLANLTARSAEQQVKAGGMSKIDGRAAIEGVIAQLEARSQEFGESAERSSILASAYKLLLMVDTHGKRGTARILAGMATWYGKAAEVAGDLDPYPALNWVCVRLLEESRRARPDAAELERLGQYLDRAERAGRALHRRDPDFWHGVHDIDADLYRLVLCALKGAEIEDLEGRLNRLYLRYLALADTFGTSRKMDSVAKQVRFLVDYLPEGFDDFKPALTELAQKLAREPGE